MKFLLKYKYVFFIAFTALAICFLNYTPHTWLSGWDTLHPELDFNLNISRLISGVWRDDQGLGSVAGHSHMSDLPRVLLLYIFNLVLPTSAVRYAYIFLMYILGPIGAYFLISNIFNTHQKKGTISFIGALYYMLNVGAIQQFFVPFEMFPTQFAFLPWIVLFSIQFLSTSSKKSLFLFSLVTLVATPQAYAAQLWYAFFGTYLAFLSIHIFTSTKNRSLQLRKSILLVLITLLLNSFWLLPNIYYIATQRENPQLAKQNRLYTQEFRERNEEFGKLKDVALIKGFYFDWAIFNYKENGFDELMPVWKTHYEKLLVRTIGYTIFCFILYGLYLSIKSKGSRSTLSFLPFFIIPFSLLANQLFPFSLLFKQLLHISLFEEALRFVFTKMSVLLILGYTIFLVTAISQITKRINQSGQKLIFITAIIALLYMGYPVFKGNLLSDKVRVQIPSDYFEMWNFMKSQPSGTIVSLPLHTISGWQYYKWGYQGSGFLWFPLGQPLLDRDSDRWNNINEEAFRELQYSLYARDNQKFFSTLSKYNIHYLLWDKNNISPEGKNRDQITFVREIETTLDWLEQNQYITTLWKKNDVSVYIIPTTKPTITVESNIPNVLPAYLWNSTDPAFALFGNYKSNTLQTDNVYFPFRSILNKYDRFNQNLVTIDRKTDSYTINIPQSDLFGKKLITPNINVEAFIEADTYLHILPNKRAQLILEPILPEQHSISGTVNLLETPKNNTITINGKEFTFERNNSTVGTIHLGVASYYPKTRNSISGSEYIIAFDNQINELASVSSPLSSQLIHFSADEVYNQNLENKNLLLDVEKGKNYVRINSKNINATGAYIDLSTLNLSRGYILSLITRNISGIPLRICLYSTYSNQCNLQDEVSKSSEFVEDTFIIPPYSDVSGYTLRIDNISYGDTLTLNDIRSVSMFPIPYNFLTQTYIESQKNYNPTSITPISSVYFAGTLYTLEILYPTETRDNNVVLWRSFNNGWIAFDTKNLKILDSHFPINNWANGWELDEATIAQAKGGPIHIVLFFWPQLLEYAGFVLLFLTLSAVILHKKRSHGSTTG